MSPVPRTTVEQWAALRAVVEAGSFGRAAERLHRSQSSVSYAVAQLQERLGIVLLRIEGRSARLTQAGRVLLAEAAPLIDDLRRLEERSRFLASGGEAEVCLLADSIFPRRRLFEALTAFHGAHPHVRLDLRETVRQGVPDPMSEAFDIAVTIWDPVIQSCQRFLDVELVAVACHDHPLHQRPGVPLTKATLSRHLRVAIRGQGWAQNPARAIAGEHEGWQVNTVEAAIEAVCHGLCYGWLPRHLVEDQITGGQLVPLPLMAGNTRQIPLGLTFADREQAGPATLDLARLLLGPGDQLRRLE